MKQHRLRMANELHKPVRRRFDKRSVFAKRVDDIWAADLVVAVFQIEQGLQIPLDSDRCTQQVWLDHAIENQDWQRSCAGVSEIVPQRPP